MKVSIEDDLTVFPMVKETIKFLDKLIGYKSKNEIVANVYGASWLYSDGHTNTNVNRKEFLITVKTNGENEERTRWRKSLPIGTLPECDEVPYDDEPLIQSMVLSMDKVEQPLAVLVFFDNRCGSVWPSVSEFEGCSTLYMYSDFISRAKAPSLRIPHIKNTQLGFRPAEHCWYASSKAKLDRESLPSNFKTILKEFISKNTKVRNLINSVQPEDGKMSGTADVYNAAYFISAQQSQHKSEFAQDVNLAVDNFNQVLEKLHADHIYQGVNGFSAEIKNENYLARALFKNPEPLRNMFESYEKQHNTNLLEEITKMEEDAKDFAAMKGTVAVTHFQASDKVVVYGMKNEFFRWYQNYTDFIESEDPLITNKIHILDAALDRTSDKSPYISGVGFTIEESEYGKLFGKTFRRSYLLDSQFDE